MQYRYKEITTYTLITAYTLIKNTYQHANKTEISKSCMQFSTNI